ncbi:hypothetical protein N7509_003431 [Penicillium cosmopolitanum]|uniref:HECT-type E3 ubiquitin transferase n=1 Tax=Penicillium cosmopolitanum TaxID=1131564 RepID=A0A9W9W501_9EURO|nr:uncharacterized protein N7509_003431 [Penicillium cosmopolitanum]KAJ5403560.1 hypothetical protein N7509_003431 [Penicillium cosmopolitanum]
MSSRSGRNPPIPSHSNPDFGGLLPSIPSSSLATERSLRRPIEPHDASAMSKLNGDPNNSYRRGHHRSISHPFTSALSSIGKKRDKAAPKHDKYDKEVKWDSDSDSDEITYPAKPISSSPRKDSTKAGPSNGTAETKCGTCNSTVRWPQHLNVFRCSDCLMITDLEPDTVREAKNAGGPEVEDRGHRIRGDRPPHSHLNPKEAHVPFAPPEFMAESLVSANRLGGMIDGCLSKYFDSLLDGTQHGPAPDENRTGRLNVPIEDPRSRSTSASSEHGRIYGTKEKPKFLIPHKGNLEEKPLPDLPIRARANSDLRSHPRPGRRPSDTPGPPDSGSPDKDDQLRIFKRLENYIIAAFKGSNVMNNSFPTYQPSIRSASSGNPPRMKMDPIKEVDPMFNVPVFEPDAKTLLLGDVAENSTWWMTEWAQAEGQVHKPSKEQGSHRSRAVSSRSPRVNWAEVNQWYHLILTAGSSWNEQWTKKKPDPNRSEADRVRTKKWESVDLASIENEITDSRLHLQRTLMKATENLLKRPRSILKKPEDTRFLFILLANPLLSSPGAYSHVRMTQTSNRDDRRPSNPNNVRSSNHHYGVLKRILGLLANLPNEAHHTFISWFSRFSPKQFERHVDLIGGFVNYRLTRQHGRKRTQIAGNTKDGDELVPSFASAAGNTPAELHAAINRRSPQKKPTKKKEAPIIYAEDWQIRAAARIMSLLFAANSSNYSRRPDGMESKARHRTEAGANSQARQQGYMVSIDSFYNTLLDYSDLIGDFEIWESKSSKFCFCRYPFFLSIWAKIRIMEHDARRQMEVKAREAFFSSILNHQAVSQYLVLKVRRECLVEDSLRGVSEVVGTGQEEIKKGLRIEFLGEEGVDAGGLRKEWFLLLVREVFDPDHGLFIYDEDSQYCYFNPYCFESSEQFFLVGVLLGLAIYNSTILDIDLPPFAFRKLLSTAPQTNAPPTANSRRTRFKFTLEDLAEYRPALARGLRGLLDFEGDVAETFCYDFVAQVDRYGEVVNIPLCTGGEKRAVDNDNRGEFVELYVHYLLETAVARQFEPFKRGFFTVCGGNALSLFRPEEIELLIRGSDEPLDVLSLRAVATYDNWKSHRPESLPVVQWFWEFFEGAPPEAQRKLLSFITGSDRIPAMGATSLTIRLACMGDDCSRYPIARTCFNTLGLYRYTNRDKFRRLLWDAVVNSEGFGLK